MSHLTHGGLSNGEHVKHALLTVLTAGLWGLVWWSKAWGSRKRSTFHYR